MKSNAGSDAPTAEQSITLNPSGAASDLIDAKENQGMGTWVNTFGKDATEAKQSVELSVPGKTKKRTNTIHNFTNLGTNRRSYVSKRNFKIKEENEKR